MQWNPQSYKQPGNESKAQILEGNELSEQDDLFRDLTVYTHILRGVKLQKEELSSPVVILNTFKTQVGVLKKANQTVYGLYSVVITKDVNWMLRYDEQLDAGTVGKIVTFPTTAQDLPVGGVGGVVTCTMRVWTRDWLISWNAKQFWWGLADGNISSM